jgi:hypothetical protein
MGKGGWRIVTAVMTRLLVGGVTGGDTASLQDVLRYER